MEAPRVFGRRFGEVLATLPRRFTRRRTLCHLRGYLTRTCARKALSLARSEPIDDRDEHVKILRREAPDRGDQAGADLVGAILAT